MTLQILLFGVLKILIFQESLLHSNFKLPDKNFWQSRCLGMAGRMTVCVTQLNIFACEYGNFALFIILILIQASEITVIAKNSSVLLDVHTLALHVRAGDCLYYAVFQSYLTIKDYLTPPCCRGFVGNNKHGKVSCIYASKAFKHRGNATGYTQVMSKSSTLPGSEK